MSHSEGYFINSRGARIFYQAWLPESPPRAVLLVVHGLGEHCGRYAGLAGYFVSLGYAVYGFDHIGHGRSGGERQHVECLEELTDTLGEFCGKVRQWRGGVPLFLLGHSMGGLIAVYHLLAGGEAAGAIFSAPSVKVGDSVAPSTLWVGKRLAVIAPKFRMLGIDRDGISRDPEVLAVYASDPLMRQGKFTVRLGMELLKAMQRLQTEIHRLTLPFILLQGGDDRIVDPGGAKWLYEEAGSIHKTLNIYPGLYHEVFNEPERGIVLQHVRDWLEGYV